MDLYVYLGIFTHSQGTDIVVYETMELAEIGRQEIAKDGWEDIMEETPMPSDPAEAADMYFEAAGERMERHDFEIQCERVVREL